jgi:hypothetical protein
LSVTCPPGVVPSLNKIVTQQEEKMNKLTVFYENPFWVGIFEREEGRKYQTSRIVFGPEPRDVEIYEFVLKNYSKLKFSRPVKSEGIKEKKINPKRLQRQVMKEQKKQGISTKAQDAMRLEREENKKERKHKSKEQRELEKKQRFEQKQAKKKDKKRGH